MRVGFDVTLSARVETGVGVYARGLETALGARDVEIRRWEHPLGPARQRVGRVANGARLAAWFTDGCARQARHDAVDMVHATAAMGPVRLGCPLVMTIHDATTVTMPAQENPADRLFQRVFAIGAARRADAVLVPTNAAAADVIEHFGMVSSRVRVVPLGVDEAYRQITGEQIATARETFGLDRPYVLYVGADAPRKNLRRLVQAKAIERSLDDFDLVIAGPHGRRDADLDALALSLGLPRPIRRLANLPTPLLAGVYGGAACLAYVSLCEGFGLPIIEAMATGVPVVTSNRSSMPEVASDAALFVDPTDAPAIADALKRATHDTAVAERLRLSGLKRSAAFSWDITARLTEAVYREVSGRTTVHGTRADAQCSMLDA